MRCLPGMQGEATEEGEAASADSWRPAAFKAAWDACRDARGYAFPAGENEPPAHEALQGFPQAPRAWAETHAHETSATHACITHGVHRRHDGLTDASDRRGVLMPTQCGVTKPFMRMHNGSSRVGHGCAVARGRA